MRSKEFWVTIIGSSILVVLLLAWGGYKIFQQHQLDVYWQGLNTPTAYTGYRFKITFPCSNISSDGLEDYLHSQNIKTDPADHSVSCTFYGGDDHSKLDMYNVNSNKYSQDNNDFKCTNWLDDTDGTSHTVIYREERFINGLNITICGWNIISPPPNGTSSTTKAIIINDNTVYQLEVLPSDKTTTYEKLNIFLTTFQLTSNGNY